MTGQNKKSSRSTPAFQSLYRSVTLDMSEMQMVSNSLLDEPFIYGSNASPSTASSMLKDLLQFALRHNPVVQAYNTMAEIMQGSTGLPLIADGCRKLALLDNSMSIRGLCMTCTSRLRKMPCTLL